MSHPPPQGGPDHGFSRAVARETVAVPPALVSGRLVALLLTLGTLLVADPAAAQPMSGRTPWAVGEQVTAECVVAGFTDHPEYLRVELDCGSTAPTFEIIPAVTEDRAWQTKRHLVMPAPGYELTETLLRPILVDLATWELLHPRQSLMAPSPAPVAGPVQRRPGWLTVAFPGLAAWWRTLVCLLVVAVLAVGATVAGRRRPSTTRPTPAPQLAPRRVGLAATAFVFTAVIGLKFAYAVRVPAFVYADALFQYVEPAYNAIHGYGFATWEHTTGTRSWFVPGVIALVLRGCGALGVSQPDDVLLILRLSSGLLFVSGLTVLYRGVRQLYGQMDALVAVATIGSFPHFLFMTNTTLTEGWGLSLTLVAFGFYYQHAANPRALRLALVGALLGLSCVVRIQLVVVPVGLLVALALGHSGRAARRHDILVFVAGFSALLAFGMILDRITWGSFAHSTAANLRAHFAEGSALQLRHGGEPWWLYLSSLWSRFLPLSPLLAIGFCLGTIWRPRDPAPWTLIAFVLVHSALIHKEERFILPVLPLLVLASVGGGIEAVRRLPRVIGWVTVALSLVLGAMAWSRSHTDSLAVANYPDSMHAAHFIGGQPDSTEICMVGEDVWKLGGYFWIGKDIPVRPFDSISLLRADVEGPATCRYILLDTAMVDSLVGESGPPETVFTRGGATVLRDSRSQSEYPGLP